jgi:RNA polymerase sigma-70 factor (ECF subfamily)
LKWSGITLDSVRAVSQEPPGKHHDGGFGPQEQYRNPMAGRATNPENDSASARRQQQADAEQQARFVQENMRRIFLQIYRVVGNVEDAQDLTQEAFIKALQRGEQLKDEAKAAHWLSRIASNTAIDFLRRQGRVNFSDLAEIPEPLVANHHTPEKETLRNEQRAYLDRGLDTLTERERMALLLRDVEDYSAEEVAEQLDCSKATVRSHIANARIKFRRYLERRGRRG